MIIPDSFKETIKNVFYDKEITLYSTEEVTDTDGWVAKAATILVSGTFLANTHFKNLDVIQEQYGIRENIDMMLTTDTNVPNETIIGYLGRYFKIIGNIPNDSHYLLMAKEWSSKSLTLISS